MTTATGTFHNTSWDEETIDESAGRKVTRASIVQELSGDLEGTATWTTLMAYAGETAEYVGILWFDGRLAGRTGGFVVRTDGRFDGGEARSTWTTVVGAATGELAGLHGAGTSVAPHGPDGTYELTYDLT